MNIQSTAKFQTKPAATPTPTSAQTPAGKLDSELSAGRIPKDIYVDFVQNVVEGKPENGLALPVNFRQQSVKDARRRNLVSTAFLAPMTATPGALLGSMAFPHAPFVGAAVGAGIGVAVALDWGSEFHGTVKVESEGEVKQREWYGNPENFQREPSELKTIFHATGVLGDKVEPVAFEVKGDADPETMRQLATHKDTLQTLARERRLVADLGGQTKYGKPALQLVDQIQARDLLARGNTVQVVNVVKSEDIEHKLTTDASSGIHNKKALREYSYTEKHLSYQLQPIERPEELSHIAEGKGLPESVVGVPGNEHDFSQVVYRKDESAGRTISKDPDGKKRDESNQSLQEVLVGNSKGSGSSGLGRYVKSMVDPSTRGYVITGAVLGTVAGMAIPGLDPAVGLTIGGFGGHFIGRRAVARTAEGTTAGPLLSKAAIAAGALAGIGIGVYAATAAGNGMAAAGAVGAFGGLFSGVLAARGNRKLASTLGMGGFVVGGYGGLGLAAMAGGPVAGVALGALGAVAGGSLGYIATRGK